MEEAPDRAERALLPVACTLGPDDGPARLQRWQRLHEVAFPVAHLADGQLEVRYQPGPGVTEELTGLADAEQRCCSFVAWTVTAVEGHPVLRVTAPAEAPESVAPIAAMFEASPSNAAESQ